MLFACFQGNFNNMKDFDSKASVEKRVNVVKWHYIGRERCIFSAYGYPSILADRVII